MLSLSMCLCFVSCKCIDFFQDKINRCGLGLGALLASDIYERKALILLYDEDKPIKSITSLTSSITLSFGITQVYCRIVTTPKSRTRGSWMITFACWRNIHLVAFLSWPMIVCVPTRTLYKCMFLVFYSSASMSFSTCLMRIFSSIEHFVIMFGSYKRNICKLVV